MSTLSHGSLLNNIDPVVLFQPRLSHSCYGEKLEEGMLTGMYAAWSSRDITLTNIYK